MTPKAIIFDLEGTLVDSARDLRTALNALLAEEGLTSLGLDAVKGMIGDGVFKLVERGLAEAGGEAVRRDPSIEVVLIIGREARIPAIVGVIGEARRNIHLVALAIETGTANLSLRDPNFAELNRVIHSLAQTATGFLRKGKVLRFTARLPANDRD